jgi:hypothetical protein
MASEAKLPVGTQPMDQAVLPYAPGWVDQLVGRIDRLPIPAWLFYPALLGIVFLLINGSRWVEGSAPFGALDAPYGFVALYPVGMLAAIHYLDGTAGRAFDFFRPALGKSETEAACLRYELTILPARDAWIVGATGLAFFLLTVLIGSPLRSTLGNGIFYWTILTFAGVGFVVSFELLYHTLRQLRLVSRIHDSAANLDLFHLAPLFSFSALTARTGLVFVLILCFDLIVNPETLSSPPLVALNAVILLLSVACFILPLQGMQRRIAAEKRRLEWDVNQHIKAMVQHLYERVDGFDVHDADPVNKTITSLLATRELIAKIPTWPWRPETSAVFFSALTLPVAVFLIQMLLKTLMGF